MDAIHDAENCMEESHSQPRRWWTRCTELGECSCWWTGSFHGWVRQLFLSSLGRPRPRSFRPVKLNKPSTIRLHFLGHFCLTLLYLFFLPLTQKAQDLACVCTMKWNDLCNITEQTRPAHPWFSGPSDPKLVQIRLSMWPGRSKLGCVH
jgi:hypothetical protein